MAAALQDLGSMQVTASDLRNQIMSVDANMNQVGRAYLRHLVDSQEHSTISNNLQLSQQVWLCTTNGISYFSKYASCTEVTARLASYVALFKQVLYREDVLITGVHASIT